MTLNGHCALKSVSDSATNGLASPAFGQNCSKIFRATHILSAKKCSPGNDFSGSIRFICRFSRGFPGEGASNESGFVEKGDFRFFRSVSS